MQKLYHLYREGENEMNVKGSERKHVFGETDWASTI